VLTISFLAITTTCTFVYCVGDVDDELAGESRQVELPGKVEHLR
jgi:hypothetical protein